MRGSACGSFRERLRRREPLVGTFMKSPSPHIAEVLGLSDLHAVVLDQEHAPFGRVDTDLCIAALRAADMPSIVRVPDASPTSLRNALDSGATGVLVPHVSSDAEARAVVKACHFGEGGRGYAGSPRAAGYGTRPMAEHLEGSARSSTVIVQIEDLAALPHVRAIAAVEGVDAVFIGRVDLAVAMGEAVSAPSVVDQVKAICRASLAVGTAVGMFTPGTDELSGWRDLGASLFLLQSDHSMVLAGANKLASSIR